MTFNLFHFLCASTLVGLSHSKPLHPRADNGLAITPPMGWNSYNHYSCSPNESIAHSNAQAVIDLGLKAAGYGYVTVDCGWTLPNRTENGTLTWNPDRFPNGFPALSAFVHKLGLKFGAYSDGGVQMCMTGEPAQAGSLGHETTDADTFASWEVDLLKYDNCYSDAASGYPDTNYAPSVSPKAHYQTMANAVLSTGRSMVFQICDWGVDFPSAWAPALGNTWRITNDIIPAWTTIARILNQAVPQTSFAGPHQWLDLDMLEVGNKIFTTPEEQTHFSLWAIIKSPLVIGTALKDTYTSISAASLSVLKNLDVISYNQDSLGVPASFRRRWTEDKYEVWSGPLSGGRTVVAVINWADESRKLTLDFPDVGIQKAGSLKDIWNGVSSSKVLTSYTGSVAEHGTLLLELGDTTPAGEYDISDAKISGFVLSSPASGRANFVRQTATFSNVYGSTSSSGYTILVTFSKALSSKIAIKINNVAYSVAAGSKTFSAKISLQAINSNTVTVTSNILPSSITVTAPSSTFYPSTNFTLAQNAALTTCATGLCIPVGSKITELSPTGSAVLKATAPPSTTSGSKFVEVYFCNNDIAFSTSWTTGTNTRNMTIDVNGEVTRVELPLSGRSSELFSPGLGWEDTGTFGVLTTGWKDGVNEVVIGNEGGNDGLVAWAPDLVGLGVKW